MNESLPKAINENWRNVFLDVTTMDVKDVKSISTWLNTFQPITLAVNGAPLSLFLEIFENSALVVYTFGTDDNPAYTCQARPQEGEVFGEFPPRMTFTSHTRFPVIVPSSTPSNNS